MKRQEKNFSSFTKGQATLGSRPHRCEECGTQFDYRLYQGMCPLCIPEPVMEEDDADWYRREFEMMADYSRPRRRRMR